MSTYIDLTSPAVGRLVAEALAQGPTSAADLTAIMLSDGVEVRFRLGYALLCALYPDLFPTLQDAAEQTLSQTIAEIRVLDPTTKATEIQQLVADHKAHCAPATVIFQEAAGYTSYATTKQAEMMSVNKARAVQALLTGRLPERLRNQLAKPTAADFPVNEATLRAYLDIREQDLLTQAVSAIASGPDAADQVAVSIQIVACRERYRELRQARLIFFGEASSSSEAWFEQIREQATNNAKTWAVRRRDYHDNRCNRDDQPATDPTDENRVFTGYRAALSVATGQS